MRGLLRDGLYHLESVAVIADDVLEKSGYRKLQFKHINKNASTFVLSKKANDGASKTVWYRRLGHSTMQVLNYIAKVCNLPINGNGDFMFCESCQLGKTHNLPFNISRSKPAQSFDLIHSDLWGPAPFTSTDDYRYYILFVDDFSKYTWIYPLKHKSVALEAFKHFITYVKTQFTKTIKAFQFDNGGEFIQIHHMCNKMGIVSRLSRPYTSAQNGQAERKHRHVTETSLSLLAQATLPLNFWWDAFITAKSLINGLPT